MTRAIYPDQALRGACSRFLGGHGRIDARLWVDRLARSPALNEALDIYSDGPAMARLEAETAALLGKEAGLFFHKGITAQQAALLVHAANTGRRVVALHPSSHFALDEHDTLDRLAGLVSRRVGVAHAPFTLAELERVAEPLAAVTVELPLRRAGFVAPTWDELAAISHWARGRGIPFHLDGARLWEVAPWYGRSLTEIAALADTVYVSFYKGLGGMGGCVLAGPAKVLAAARPWRNRFGGDLPTIFPYVLTALDGLRRHLPRMGEYHAHAVAIAAAIGRQPGLRARPEPPHGNSFQIHFDAPAAALEAAATAMAREQGIWLFNRFEALGFPDRSFGELVVGEATLDWAPEEAAIAIAALLAQARKTDA
jgi:threonine aldolase